ncbi:MAG: polyprenyl synthetase family protein [Lachnospiraceae bacterium]|nr:polyprenyl synthetase family protein [Lachnospiraceae bacterium]
MKYSAQDIENIIYNYLPEEEGYQKDVIIAMNYAFKAGGKRLRPMIMKLCYDMFSHTENLDVLAPFMAAIEMIHTYSLVHDDLPALDNDMYRRGQLTCHAKFGEDMAILAGDGLLNYAFEVASKAFLKCPGDVKIEKAFVSLARRPGIYGMIGGQVLDVCMSGKPLDDKQIDFINLNKTAALIMCSMEIGGLLGGANEEVYEQLGNIGRCVGLAFQVQDDILDIVGDEAKLGKPVRSDEKNAKYNYATVHGLEKAKEFVRSVSADANKILEDMDVVDNQAKKELMDLINMLINREY